jgi:CRP-like cAMP-binding protein
MYERILKNIAKFIQLTPQEAEYFISILHHKKVKKRQYLFHEGEICRYQFFVNKGCLRSYHTDDKGMEHVAQFAIEDWWISDMYSFLTSTPARLNVDAVEDSEVLYFDKPSIEKFYIDVPKFERFARMQVQNGFITNQQRIVESMSLDAEQRYCNFIGKYPLMEQRLPLKQIASYLGITPESLSRIRSKYAKNTKG